MSSAGQPQSPGRILVVEDDPEAESRGLGWLTGPLFVYIGGYGPLLCAVTAAAYGKELRHAEARWEKTEKTGKVVAAT